MQRLLRQCGGRPLCRPLGGMWPGCAKRGMMVHIPVLRCDTPAPRAWLFEVFQWSVSASGLALDSDVHFGLGSDVHGEGGEDAGQFVAGSAVHNQRIRMWL